MVRSYPSPSSVEEIAIRSGNNGEASSTEGALASVLNGVSGTARASSSSISTASDTSRSSTTNEILPYSSEELHTISKYSRFRGTKEPLDALIAMREVLDTISENDVNGPRLFRLDSEFGLELGKGTQFRVTGPSDEFKSRLERAQAANSNGSMPSLGPALESLASSVVKRARWTPDLTNRRHFAEARGEQLSREDLTKELHSQLRSAKVEIERLCHKPYENHANIVRLRGWGLCLDTFEATTSLNTRIPLLILERATCDLGDFLASSNYNDTPFKTLLKICSDIGTGLGALHAGNMTHGDMKPENVLLFAENSPDQEETNWTAKLCDFGNAETKSAHNPLRQKGKRIDDDLENQGAVETPKLFEYYGTPGWIPPEALPEQQLEFLDFESLKRCDVFVYGLIVWRIFEDKAVRGEFDIRTKRRLTRVRPIKENNVTDYLPPKDRAYKDASKAIRKAAETRITSTRMLIPSRMDMNRVLRVLRAALQPVPRFRDPRPWKFFDTTYYPNIRVFDETPGREAVENRFYDLARAAFWACLSLVVAGVSTARDIIMALVYGPFILAFRYLWQRLQSFIRKPPRQVAFETLFSHMSSHIQLGWDPSNVSPLDHTSDFCHNLFVFQTEFLDYCKKEGVIQAALGDHQFYSYARLRSRFKLCCWQHSLGQRQPNDVLPFFLWGQRNEQAWAENMAESPEDALSTIAWLYRGEIGESELRTMEAKTKDSAPFWSCVYDHKISMEMRNLLFQLFVEKGCYVGVEVDSTLTDWIGLPLRSWWPSRDQGRRDTVFGRFLMTLVEGSMDVNTNYDHIITACAKVAQISQKCISQAPIDDEGIIIAKRRFFFNGESPDGANEELNVGRTALMAQVQMSTVLHEAVSSCCYPAVEYFVQNSTIPLIVCDHNGQTALELALSMKELHLKPWQRVQIDTIIGLLSQNSKLKSLASDLPLGWDKIEFEPGFVAYHESTVNPNNPSLTFEPPRFSLLQERQIPLGSRKSAAGGLTYDFDLVRFMHKPKLDDSKRIVFIFNDQWYKADIKKTWDASGPDSDDEPGDTHLDEQTALLIGNRYSVAREFTWRNLFLNRGHTPGTDADRIWVRIPALILNSTKVVLLRNYTNIFLAFVPCSILYRELASWNANTLLIFAFLGALPLIEMWEATMLELNYWLGSSIISQTLVNRIASCITELFIGISALLYGDTELIQQLIIGSVMCSHLLIPGFCFLYGGIYNSRTGASIGIRQEFNSTTQGLLSTLTSFASVISAILYLFVWTQNVSSPEEEIGVVALSRIASIIALIIFAIWLWFRYKSHTNLFDTDFLDGYENDADEYEPQLSRLANMAVGILCLIGLNQQTQSIVLSLENLTPQTRRYLVLFGVPVLLRISKHVKAIRFAIQDKLDDALDLTIGFAVTICLFFGPLLVLLSWILGSALTLRFDLYGTIGYTLSAWVLASFTSNGVVDWMKGAGLIAVYMSIHLACYLLD